MSKTAPAPKISVVIASKVGAPFIDQCLESIRAEATGLGGEVIVVACGDTAYAARIRSKFPWVRVLHETQVTQVPALRARGVEAARSELVAIIEEHCSAAPDWLAHAIAAHETGTFAAVGGPVVDADYRRLQDWVVYFVEYNVSLPPAPRGETNFLNEANICYRRAILLQHRELLDSGYWQMTLHPTLLANGIKLLSVPEMVVHHRGPFNFGYYLGQRFLFSRAYAGVRAQHERPVRRLAYLVGAPLIPFMLLARISLTVFRKRCRVPQFLMSLPLVGTALVTLTAGEWVGCLLGPGDALARVE